MIGGKQEQRRIARFESGSDPRRRSKVDGGVGPVGRHDGMLGKGIISLQADTKREKMRK
jgi:hypothetical protein